MAPHRGPLILALGILSLVTSCFPLGFLTWWMGSRDQRLMQTGRMDPSGALLTQAGQVCGIISALFFVLGLLGFWMGCCSFGLLAPTVGAIAGS